MNRIDQLFQNKPKDILNVYCTAGYPSLNDTVAIVEALQQSGADMVELGMPFSDPLADGPVIQESSTRAIKNGMRISVLFEQLKGLRSKVSIPLVLMGYMNPVMQFGVENFLQKCAETGVDGLILPDLPMDEYESQYKPLFEKYGLHNIFLVTPETNEARIRRIDGVSNGFVYAVSSSSTTGKDKDMSHQEAYFQRLKAMNLRNPVLIGFGIKDSKTFREACRHSNGAIIGSAFVKAIENSANLQATVKEFVAGIKS
ncbi:tryptophan synthase subunit alpha [Chitinophaga sp. GCM10012297]|uniref:Tryptophan synthase alpha chain n=1 Tax=Chitinophaga chungangae TaxID=2821488 RepID=A0ABS3Y8P5_9BACT|nr:tryptophan synthase subunit alpha [Chitinophaga chungangae]MBO9151021.1 tryptophan synthase subunit alpha [Chitinophaga chungangae]